MKKTIVFLLFIAVILYSFAGCAGSSDNYGDFDDDFFYISDEEILSNSCDAVLYEGQTGNDYYQLVANEEETYEGTTITVGVIKNNEWMIQMSESTPFHDENGFLIDGLNVEQAFECFEALGKYLGYGCFALIKPSIIYPGGILWNTEENISYDYEGMMIIPNCDFCETKIIIDVESEMPYVVDTETMLTMPLEDPASKTLDEEKLLLSTLKFSPYSEGLYGILGGKVMKSDCGDFYDYYIPQKGFYDLSGNCIINLDKYDIITSSESEGTLKPYFINGKCTIRIKNDQGSEYDLTIDKKGNVLESINVGG